MNTGKYSAVNTPRLEQPTNADSIIRSGHGALATEPRIRIHTLGRFGIQIDGRALSPKELRQQKPIELLQCLIALGGRGINKGYLSASVWPEADGDGAANCYDVTLHRLRKLLKHENALLASDSRLTLNNTAVWVDAWTFERLLTQIDSLMQAYPVPEGDLGMVHMLDQAMRLYQGGFLIREALKPWGLQMQERLRSRLMRSIVRVGAHAENHARWEICIHCYQTGLEIDPLYELFYQRLMICYRATRRIPEALAVYQRCRANLATGLHVAPSPETDKIRSSL